MRAALLALLLVACAPDPLGTWHGSTRFDADHRAKIEAAFQAFRDATGIQSTVVVWDDEGGPSVVPSSAEESAHVPGIHLQTAGWTHDDGIHLCDCAAPDMVTTVILHELLHAQGVAHLADSRLMTAVSPPVTECIDEVSMRALRLRVDVPTPATCEEIGK